MSGSVHDRRKEWKAAVLDKGDRFPTIRNCVPSNALATTDSGGETSRAMQVSPIVDQWHSALRLRDMVIARRHLGHHAFRIAVAGQRRPATSH